MKRRGRPRSSPLPRPDQLRLAKRAQRERDRRKGLELVQLRLPGARARRLRAAARLPDFQARLEEFLGGELLRVDDYPVLRSLLWTGRRREFLPAEEAFKAYERHWRFVSPAQLRSDELALVERLKRRFGKGLLNA